MHTNSNQHLANLRKSLRVYLLAASLLFVPASPGVAAAQDILNAGQIQYSFSQEGVSGTYTIVSKVYSFDSTFLSKRAFRARILRPDNTLLVECLREGDTMLVKFPTGDLTIDMVKKKTALPDAESKALGSFSVTEEAALVRGLVYNLSLQRTDNNQKLLVGFAVIALLLGEGQPAGATGSFQKMKGQTPVVAQKVSYLKCPAKTSAAYGDCHGCCGAGCWGCTNCYTNACLAHDNCVNDLGYFHPVCQALSTWAAASMVGCVVN